MRLRRYLRPEMIRLDLDVGGDELDPELPAAKVQRLMKERVMAELAELLAASGRVGKVNKLATDLLNREKKATTAIGDGIAMPHVRTPQAKELVMAVAISPTGIDFGAADGELVRIFIALVAPSHDDKLYLRVVKEIAEVLSSQEDGEWGVREQLLHAESPEDVIWALTAQ